MSARGEGKLGGGGTRLPRRGRPDCRPRRPRYMMRLFSRRFASHNSFADEPIALTECHRFHKMACQSVSAVGVVGHERVKIAKRCERLGFSLQTEPQKAHARQRCVAQSKGGPPQREGRCASSARAAATV